MGRMCGWRWRATEEERKKNWIKSKTRWRYIEWRTAAKRTYGYSESGLPSRSTSLEHGLRRIPKRLVCERKIDNFVSLRSDRTKKASICRWWLCVECGSACFISHLPCECREYRSLGELIIFVLFRASVCLALGIHRQYINIIVISREWPKR